MSQVFNIYCDESCHLEHDRQEVMLLGCVWAPKDHVSRLSRELRDIKKRHNACGELKWTKVSKSREKFFLEVIQWFFAESPMHFRCLVVQNKSSLNHEVFNQGSHDTFYYKMYFSLLNKILEPNELYDIYLDIKDSRSRLKVQKLYEVLCNDKYDFTREMIRHLQHIRSNESELLQVTDLLLGAVAYKHRNLNSNKTKLALVEEIEKYHETSLLHSTPLSNKKFNIFIFHPQAEGENG